MNRSSIALFLSTLALAGGTVACRQAPETRGEDGSNSKELRSPDQPEKPRSPSKDDRNENQEDREAGEGGEGGEG